MANTQKYKLTKGSHSRLEDGSRVRKEEGDIFVPTDRELEKFPWKFEPVLKEESADNDVTGGADPKETGKKDNDKNGEGAGNETDNNKPGNEDDGKDDGSANDENSNTDDNLDTKDITELSTRDAGPLISECEDAEQLKIWLAQEKDGDNRSTIIKALESRINAVEEGE